MVSIRLPLGVTRNIALRASSWLAAAGIDVRRPFWLAFLSCFFKISATQPDDWETCLAPLFPHIDLRRLRLADVIRLPLQMVWLILVKPPSPRLPAAPQPRAESRLRRRAAQMGAAFDRRWLASTVVHGAAPGAFDRLLDIASGQRLWGRAAVAASVWMAGGGIALLAMSTPLDPVEQAIFCAIVLAALLVLSRGSGPAALAALCLAGALSARYFWWRAGETLYLPQQLDLTWGLLLLLAEMLLWLVAAVRSLGNGARRNGPPPGFVVSLARVAVVTAPAAALLFDIRLIDATAPLLALYAVPHLLAAALVFRPRAAQSIGMARQECGVADAWSTLRGGGAAPILLAWLNLLAVGAGVARLAWGMPEDPGMVAVFLLWACFNMPVLAIAVSRAGMQAQDDGGMPPSRALAAVLDGHRRLLAATMQAPWQWTGGLRAAIAWWLPRPPVALRMLAAAVTLLSFPAQDLQANPQPASATSATSAPGKGASLAGEQTRRVSLKDLSGLNSLALRTTNGSASVYFGSRGDELVTRMKLVLRYSHSPALLPKDSHIKVMLNDEVIGVAPIVRDPGGQALTLEIDIDPRFIVDRNQLRFHFIGHYAATCEDPLRNSLWADISGASELVTSFAPLPQQQNDLSLLPEPFYDRRDLRHLTVPVIFSPAPALPTLNAAAIVTSWFGKLAGERGAEFPSHLDVVPPGHGVVIATNADRPAFLRGHAPVDGPTLEMITNPTDGYSKLLLVLGRDGNDVNDAAQSLVLGYAAMSGSRVTINSRRFDAPRAAYDAPKWVRSDRPTRLGDLLDYPQQLQATGHVPRPLKLDLKIPPDIFSLGNRGAPMTLRYRYSPPMRSGESLLTLGINGALVQSFDLSPKPNGNALAKIFLGTGDNLLTEEQRLSIPAYKFKGQNTLQFAFAFARHQEGPCPDIPPDDTRRAQIDPDSTLDFSGFRHFARMPNLNAFATVGFPFTKYADLSQTVIVMPEHPSIQEIETVLTLLGHFGNATGLPASRVRIVGPSEISLLENADLLVIGSALGQGALANWGPHLPATVNGTVRHISQPARAMNFLYDWLGLMEDADAAVVTQEKFSADGPLALMLGFQSPLTPGRSVVAITASTPDQLWRVMAALSNPERVGQIHGGVSFIREQRVESLRVGDSYFVGELPWWVTVWLPFSAHPVLLALLTIAAGLLITMVAWRIRLRRKGEKS